MHRLSSVEEFLSFQKQITDSPRTTKPTLVVSAGTCGQASGASGIIRIIKRFLIEHNLQEQISLRITGCQGFCEMEPFILVEPGKHFYTKIEMKDVPRVIEATLSGKVVEDLLYRESEHHTSHINQDDIPFFKKQKRIILGKNDLIDPIRIFDYIKHGGYLALAKALMTGNPEWIIEEIQRSGLRGRGGAGFPTGKKWELARAAKNGKGQKYIICNADEGDPGAYMDRSLLEGNPHAVLEGLIIGGIAIGATKGYIYARGEYPLAIKHALIAIRQAREMGILGENLLNSDIDFDIEIVRGAGAFVCGEETALIASIEGKIGEPKQRPPFPVEKGLWGRPTCINNVETLSNVPVIISKGADQYSKVGVPGNSGTKIFSLVGKIKNTGLVEVPMGTTIREIIYDIGGGSVGNAPIKAVQTGGPSGGCIPAEKFDLAIDYDTLAEAGSIMGSGGMIVMDENSCMVDIAKYYMNFLKDESCGKCYTCRKGTQRMFEILEDISQGKGTLEQLDLLEELAHVVADTTMCGLGQNASNPVLSTLRYFREEYIEHVIDKHCRAGVCKDLVGAPCQAACPIGTEAWRYVAHIAEGEYEKAYLAIRETNPFPSICSRVCDHKCEERCRLGQTGTDPVAIRALKRFVTDNVDPAIYKPERTGEKKSDKVAIIGAGPAGLTAAHNLSLKGYPVTVFETDSKPGGMMFSCIPAYRLPREVLEKEIDSILDENITMQFNTVLGKDITIDKLFKDGYKSVFVGIGAQKERRLKLEGEESEGVYPSIEFLKAYNVNGEQLAKGRVGVIGGGNSALDAARTALRQDEVESVNLLYRRTREEMPAFDEEIEAAFEEKIVVETLVTPVRIITENGRVRGIECIRNKLGNLDNSGRRRPVPIPGSEFIVPVDTLIVAISEQPDTDSISPEGEPELSLTEWGTLEVDKNTSSCSRPGVFAGGDVVTGPNTVIDAIAAGRKAAVMIDRYLRGEELWQQGQAYLPKVYVEPYSSDSADSEVSQRVEPEQVTREQRLGSFKEVEMTLSEKSAKCEAIRCLRCDLEFTQPKTEKTEKVIVRTPEVVEQ
ncbi:MAG: NADH-ubiquinone oxidoreductase-F iron-sulfur binding region domain-containing protein [Candidatus Electryonea clarkiae]|nr:NADH-ubiquinone oxidoreductase-F iron-sulfur binding region domain-containing protein [Candidatus Electryonea clarkiae]